MRWIIIQNPLFAKNNDNCACIIAEIGRQNFVETLQKWTDDFVFKTAFIQVAVVRSPDKYKCLVMIMSSLDKLERFQSAFIISNIYVQSVMINMICF